MWVKDIEIENYKSIRDQHFSPSEFSVLVGKNNTGKSNVTDALSDFQWTYNGGTNQAWKMSRLYDKDLNRQAKLGFHVVFDDNEYYRILDQFTESFQNTCRENGWLREARVYQNYGEGHNADQDVIIKFRDDWTDPRELSNQEYTEGKPEVVFDIITTSVQSWRFIDPFRKPRDTYAPSEEMDIDPDGENLVRVLGTIDRSSQREKFQNIKDEFIGIMQGATDLHLEWSDTADNELTVVMEEEGFSSTFSLENMSSGTIQILLLLTQIILAEENSDLLVVEEPELHLHPGAEKQVFDLLEKVSNKYNGPQVIVSTHSEVFVDHSRVDDIVAVSKDSGETILNRVDHEEWDGEAILGIDNSDLVQSEGVVFVEGRSDKAVLEQFAESLGRPFTNQGVEVIVGGGDELKSGTQYIQVLDQLRIPYIFVLDSDSKNPGEKQGVFASDVGTSPENVFVWEKYSIESYLIHPETVADIVNSDSEEEIRNRLGSHDLTSTNMKNVLDDVFSDVVGISYDEEQSGALIAKNMPVEAIDDEVEELLERIDKLC